MSSFVVAPVRAARVPAVCRRSWKRSPRMRVARTAGSQTRLRKLFRSMGSPSDDVKT